MDLAFLNYDMELKHLRPKHPHDACTKLDSFLDFFALERLTHQLQVMSAMLLILRMLHYIFKRFEREGQAVPQPHFVHKVHEFEEKCKLFLRS